MKLGQSGRGLAMAMIVEDRRSGQQMCGTDGSGRWLGQNKAKIFHVDNVDATACYCMALFLN